MSVNELFQTRRVNRTRGACVVLAAGGDPAAVQECVASVRLHAGDDATVVQTAPDAASVNRAVEELAPADVVLLDRPCRLGPGWLQRMRAAADSDTNVASVSALADRGSLLALDDPPRQAPGRAQDFDAFAAAVAERSHVLRPRLSRAVGPCVYIRRDAFELVGMLDGRLELSAAVEIDFAQRCVLSGLTHVAADDVVVEALAPPSVMPGAPTAALNERYPYLAQTQLADSAVLAHALQSAREPLARLAVTLDARALDGAITGTHVHVLELILALARTDALELRLLLRAERVDRQTRELLASQPHTTLLAAEELGEGAPRSAVFHRPQQTFSPSDVALALALGERFVLSQLDMIAYRNPGYFQDAATWQDYRAASRHGLSAAERVVVFSEHTREELLSDALADAARLAVVPPGIDHRAIGAHVRPSKLAEHAFHDGFLLCLGTDFRHKNRVFALRLLGELRARHAWRGGLVLAGTHISPGSSQALESAYLARHPELAEQVVSIGAVDAREKAWLIDNARAVVYPSTYEGFGLVPFESALSGVPCVFAPQASLAETAPGGTATIVPWDAALSAANAYELLTDPDRRSAHLQALAARARQYTWDRAARAIVEIYRQAAAAPVRDAATLSRDLVRREARLSVQHDEQVAQLVGEREHARAMYDSLNTEVGFGLRLIGPRGALPEDLQRALLAISGRPTLSRPLFGLLSGVFVAARAVWRPIRALLGLVR